MLTPVRLRRPVRGRLHILTHGIHAQTSINHGSINLLGSRSGFLGLRQRLAGRRSGSL